ncbi:hypothetical protein DFP95_107148 [Cohnella lupini]|uniref:Uncharacterized protein n=1 Tax=Cohnella lupini TaxID=1294267 RepID=A0A3D9ICN1_9BACL|nr:hypothetical protein DFP95_107148 [Cohnella lupini]
MWENLSVLQALPVLLVQGDRKDRPAPHCKDSNYFKNSQEQLPLQDPLV